MSKRVWNHHKQIKSVWNPKKENQESLKSKKTKRVWNRKRPGESGIKKTWRVWDQKDQESLEPEEGRPGESGTEEERPGESSTERESRPGESGTGRGETRGVWNRKREDRGSVELNERVQGVLQKISKIRDGRGI
jgi:hypothetical protein